MKSLSCDPRQEKEAEVTNSTLSFQTLGLDQAHYSKVDVSHPQRTFCEIGTPLLQSHDTEDFSKWYL